MTIETDHIVDRDEYPPKPAVITLTIGNAEHELTPAQTREVITALTRELDAIQRHQANVNFTNNPAEAAHLSRAEWVQLGRQRQHDAVAAQEAADAAERRRKAQEVADRRAAVYAARKAEDDAKWQARAQRIRAERTAQEDGQ